MFSENSIPWICFGVSAIFNIVSVFLYVRLSKQTKAIRTFKVDTLDLTFCKDLLKENKENKQ